MPTPLILPSFAAGELSPALHGRVDLAKYHVGLATCLNWYVLAEGGATTRPGTAIVEEIEDSSVRNRQIGFQFSQVQSYILDFGNLTLRFIKDGGYVLEGDKPILGITRANPGVVHVTAHGYSDHHHIWLDDIVGMTQLNRRQVEITRIDADHFSIGIDTTLYTPWASGGTVARFYTIATPYLEADLPLLKFVQSADTLTITHPAYSPRNLTRTSHTSWTLTVIDFQPVQQPPTDFSSDAVGGAVNYAVTAINDATGEESRPLFGTSATQTSTIFWTFASGASIYNVYKVINGIYGFIGQGTSQFTDNTITPNVSSTTPIGTNPFPSSGNLPGCSTYHDGRQVYGRTDNQPQTLFFSQSANFKNMDVSRPTSDSDAITRTIASKQVDEIRFLVSFNDLLVFTSGAVWKAWPGAQGDVITPANCNVKTQTYDGIAQVEPITTADAILYVTTSGKRVREIAYTYASDTFTGPDRSVLSKHLFKGRKIINRAYCPNPDGLSWWLCDDGLLLGFTYLREHDVYAWSRHTTDGVIECTSQAEENNESILYLQVARTVGGATRRYIERMSTRQFGDIYDAWCLDCAYRYDGWNTDTSNRLRLTGAGDYLAGESHGLLSDGFHPFSTDSVGQKYIIRIGQNQATVTVTAFVNNAHVTVTLDMAAADVLRNTLTSDWALASTSLGGLWHLEGRTVTIFADGGVVSTTAVVTNGTVTVPQAAGRILAGLPYVCDLETLNIEQGEPTMQGRFKRVSDITIRLKETRGLMAGPSEDRLTTIKERSTETYGYPTLLTTGDERITIDPSWNENGRLFIRQSNPLPATVVAIIPTIGVGT